VDHARDHFFLPCHHAEVTPETERVSDLDVLAEMDTMSEIQEFLIFFNLSDCAFR